MNCILGKRYSGLGTAHQYITGDRAKARETILNSILPGAKMIPVSCLCGNSGNSDKVLANIDRWGLPARSVLCSHCGLIRVDPRWDDGTYARIYREYFWPLQVGFFDITKERFDLSVRRAAPFAQFLKSHVNLTEKSLLEIGCSYGAGLTSLKETGAELTGYDYDERCLTYGRTFTGLDLRPGGIKEAISDRNQYDVVVLRHVLEHFLNPLEECLVLESLLKEDGVLFVEVPGIFNLNDIGNDPLMYFNVFHTFSYTLSTLTGLMTTSSLTRIYGDEKVNSLWVKGDEGEGALWHNPKHSDEIITFFHSAEKKYKKLQHHGFVKKIKSYSQRLKNKYKP
ncbi:MAG: methyltransferase domain-containing protein [Deltaproteobacteria bacterium]|nr:methyltransferase domain-containing protein [Deltaproteobacteria bacterium]